MTSLSTRRPTSSATRALDAGPARRRLFPRLATTSTFTRMLRIARGDHANALLDQALVSGMSFVATLLIGRSSSASELGTYALAASLLVSVVTIQDALVAVPYAVARGGTSRRESAQRAGDALMQWALLSGLTALAFLAAAALIPSGKRLLPVLLVLSLAAPLVLLRDLVRRYAFAHMHFGHALGVDAAAAAMLLGGLLLLAASGELSAPTAFAANGVASALAAGLWLYRERDHFVIVRSRLAGSLRQSWRLSRWLLYSQITLLVQAYAAFWLLGKAAGSAAAGIYAACLSLALLANPLIIGIGNTIVPKAAEAFRTGGAASLLQQALLGVALMSAAMAPVCAAMWLFGEEALSLLYAGGEYAGHGHVVLVLALATLAAAIGTPAGLALQGVGRAKPVFYADALAAVMTVGLVAGLIPRAGVLGAAQGVLLGSLIGSVGRWIALMSATRGELTSSSWTVGHPRQSESPTQEGSRS